MSVQVICKFYEVSIKTKPAMLRTRSNMAFFGTKGQGLVTPRSIVPSNRNSKSSAILCLCQLSASLVKIRLKLKKLCLEQGRIRLFFCM